MSLSVLLTAAGVIIAALGDFSFDIFGYSMALTSVFFQVQTFFLNYELLDRSMYLFTENHSKFKSIS